MKKILLGIVLLLALSSCKDTQTKFVSSDSKMITNEDWFMVTHADSSDLLPCIVMDNYVLVIKDSPDKTEILKIYDYSGEASTLVSALFVMIIMVFILAILIK